ncbi:hypothetical protein K466DRAFT_488754 [Polyporus arcularius HHB13444]|uniref:GYF domain-containing protein n=1 Tax=Polyporus arcularius HHB13444 TaxID=1314778 RepID=A0A5C3PFJ2_9APHY|nr:hypothetical protein K466DRAFT_488754 [Polyporus arcularius HHB13444]
MTTTTMHFGPEWMRTKGTSRPAPSPPLTTSPAPPGNSTYSALVAPASHPPQEGRDDAHPFRYSKEEMLRIYKEGGGRGGLGLEVERWEGIVREVGYDPIGLKEMSDAEKKLFAGTLNSEVRRRQSTDFLSPLNTSGLGERPKLNHASSGAGSPMRERIGSFMGRRRGDSTDQAPMALPRKLSLSNMQGGLASPRDGALPSPRVRPGFEGVLGETWTSRRRGTSEGTVKVGTGPSKDKDTDGENKGPDFKEEEEDALRASEHGRESSASSKVENGTIGANGVGHSNGQPGGSSISGQGDSAGGAGRPPPGLADLSNVEWSYLDPQGQLQGPFKADLMQRWYNEGYFQPTLLMKRTHLDADFTPVGELVRRAGDQPVFLSPLVHAVAPPGLSRLETVVDRAIPERNQHSPYQPVPTRNIRSSTLDSYLQNGSNASDSPASSFGGRFVNGSPDPTPFGSQLGLDQNDQSRTPFMTPGAGVVGTPGQRRATMTDPMDQVFGNRGFGMGRPAAVDGAGYNGNDSPSVFNEGLGGTPFGQRMLQDPGHLNGIGGSSSLNGPEYGAIGGIHSNQGTPSRVLNRDAFAKPILDDIQTGAGRGGSFSNHSSPFISHAQQAFPQTPLSQFAGQEGRSLHPITPLSDRQPMPFAQQLQQPFVQSPGFAPPQSPWHAQEVPAFRRPGPFDANHPTVNNTFIAQPITPSQSFGRGAPGGTPINQSPWQTTAPSQPVTNEPWGPTAASLTAANLGQHDAQQRQAELQRQVVAAPSGPAPEPEPKFVTEEPQSNAAPSPITPSAPSPTDLVASQKTRRKSSAQPAQTTPQAPKVAPVAAAPAPVAPVKPPSPAPQPEPKAAWAIEDDKKSKGPGVTLNLREIQEAEAKKLEARKAAERERERAARASTQSEDFQPFTASWGLPTSQAGARAAGAVKDTPAASPFSPAASTPSTPAVWTNAAKVPAAKKTMKEIQEEEERRKKLAAKEKESVAAAARRAYADTTTKPAAATPQMGGAWTTVGSNGKGAAVTIAGVRPAATATPPAKVTPTASSAVSSSAATTRPTSAAQVVRPAAVALKSTPSKEDTSVAPGPSLEFLKWMGDSLKGLNSSVNLEELTSMLLSFPLDPDSTTMEIISDLIYASSTTLDGRRFASEFVSKRKADATSRPKGAAAGGAAKQISIADVVKAQPKPAQNEWSGFKVVNKKKKGARP